MTNTEKPTTKAEQKKQGRVSTPKKNVELAKTPIQPKTEEKQINQKDEQLTEEKKPVQKKPKVKRTEAVVNARGLHISTKYSVAICKFIKNKRIENAITDLEQVLVFKKAVPMKGEIAHRKGKGMMSGKFPKKATENFIKLLKNLSSNANVNELDNPVIVEAVANLASRPYGRFGRIRKKRSHVKIIAREKKMINKKKKEKKK